jgi:peptide/nickel transport system substrate-binding protein
LVTVLAACGGGSTTTTTTTSPKFGGNIKVGLDADVTTLDPLQSSSLYDRQVMLNIYDTLVRLDAHNSIVPDLATSWSYKTPTQLVFTLRTDVAALQRDIQREVGDGNRFVPRAVHIEDAVFSPAGGVD